MDKKRLVYIGCAGVLVGCAVYLGLIHDKETAWQAFRIVLTYLIGI